METEIATTKFYSFWYQNVMVRDTKELSELIRTSLKNYYKTSIVKRVCDDSKMPEKTARGFFYRKTQLKPFDLMILLFRYDFIRHSVGLIVSDTEFYSCGDKLRGKTSEIVIKILKDNSDITIKQLADTLQVSYRSAEYQVAKLVKMNLVRRIGSRKKGEWKVIKNDYE